MHGAKSFYYNAAPMTAAPLRLCLVDMNNGVANEATRCFRRIFDAFSHQVRAANPSLEIQFRHVQPRNLGELPSPDLDLVMSSGGPGSPFDGFEDPWCVGYRKFLDKVIEANRADPLRAPAVFVVCHSFEIAVNHLRVAQMTKRDRLKFGVMPAYVTDAGMRAETLRPFADRLFVWEHRSWQASDLDPKRLADLGGELWAVESRPGGTIDKGPGLLGFRFAPGLQGTQFHPEADMPGVMAWINRPEHAADLRDAYGHALYERMIKTLKDPLRLARTFALLLPGWLTARFNQIAPHRGLRAIAAPEQVDMRQFEESAFHAAAV